MLPGAPLSQDKGATATDAPRQRPSAVQICRAVDKTRIKMQLGFHRPSLGNTALPKKLTYLGVLY